MKETRRLYLHARGTENPIPAERLRLAGYCMQVHLQALSLRQAQLRGERDEEAAEKLANEAAALRTALARERDG